MVNKKEKTLSPLEEVTKKPSKPKKQAKKKSAITNEAATAHERAGVTADDYAVGQTLKDAEQRPEPDSKPTRTTEHERLRSAQTHADAWDYGVGQEYAPTSHTSNKMRRRVLDVQPSLGSEADHSDAVMGAAVRVLSDETRVPVRKQEWKHTPHKPEVDIADRDSIEWHRPV